MRQNIKKVIKEETKDIRGIFERLKRRDLKGNSGQAIKNSVFQISRTLISKSGSIIFTIILARLLLPELFGFYSLALSTLVFFSVFSDLGVSNALVIFVSKSLGKKDYSKAKGYFLQLLKIKLLLTVLSVVIILGASYFISVIYYKKPIFYALIIGAFYVAAVTLMTFLEAVLMSENKFKKITRKEVIFQISRLVAIPLLVILLIKISITNEIMLTGIFGALTILNILIAIYLYNYLKRKSLFLNYKEKKLTFSEKNRLKKFILPISAMSLSGIFFGYIDIMMLGHFVKGQFIAYYSIAFNLAASSGLILGFSATALFPIFSRLKGIRLKSGFRKTRRITLLISILGAVLLFLFSSPIVKIIYGIEYSPAIFLLKIFSIILIIEPMVTLYNTYYMSQERTRFIAILLISTTIINIVLNYILITNGLKTGMFEAVAGACYATISSKILYLLGLGILRKNN